MKKHTRKYYYIVHPNPDCVDIGDWYLNNLIGYSKSIGIAKMYYRMLCSNPKLKNVMTITMVEGDINYVKNYMMDSYNIRVGQDDELMVAGTQSKLKSRSIKYVVSDAFYSENIGHVIDQAMSQYSLHTIITSLRQMIILCKFLSNYKMLSNLILLLYKFYLQRILIFYNCIVCELDESVKEKFKLSDEDCDFDVIDIDMILYRDCVGLEFDCIVLEDEELPFR